MSDWDDQSDGFHMTWRTFPRFSVIKSVYSVRQCCLHDDKFQVRHNFHLHCAGRTYL